VFRITARTVLELGSELISSDIIAFYELIKNGFDAGTKNGVTLAFDFALPRNAFLKVQDRQTVADGQPPATLADLQALAEELLLKTASPAALAGFRAAIAAANTPEDLLNRLHTAQARFNTITVGDTGSGMSLHDLQSKFLVIGTASRKREVDQALAAGAAETPYLGEKGIGRLSAMRLGERLRVETARAQEANLNILEIDWRAFANVDAMLDQIPVAPTTGGAKTTPHWSGTSIIISDLTESWSQARVIEMAEYDFARLTDPFADADTRPRIVITWNGERASIPVMPPALLQAAHARIFGDYKVVDGKPLLVCTAEAMDLGFEHPHEKEIVTLAFEDLQGTILGKDSPIEDRALIDVGPFSFEAHWFNRRRLSRIDAIGEQRAVRELQERWSGILLFRDRFRVFPYGEEEDDWLALDRRALRRSGYTLNKTQFIGRVNISRTANRNLVDQTNREGLRVTPEQHVLLQVLQYAVQDRLGGFMRDVERQHKAKKIDLSDAQAQVSTLEARAKTAINKLKSLTPPEGDEAIEDLQQTLFEFSDFAARARLRIAEVEAESRQMIDMAGVGLMVEVVAHELARASENALKALDGMQGRDVPERLRAHFSTLRAEMKSVSKRVRVLDPLSISGRQRAEQFLLDELIRETFDAHDAQFTRHHITLTLDLPERPLRVRAVKGMVVQILENLISNSVYWLDMRREREPGFKPAITVSLDSGPPTISFSDNGRGIAVENREQIFKAFFSLKETKKRRGLGLFIAREAARHNGGDLQLSHETILETGRLHRFTFELPPEAQL